MAGILKKNETKRSTDFIGLQAATRASSGAQYYRPPDELTAMYQVGQSVQDIENQGENTCSLEYVKILSKVF